MRNEAHRQGRPTNTLLWLLFRVWGLGFRVWVLFLLLIGMVVVVVTAVPFVICIKTVCRNRCVDWIFQLLHPERQCQKSQVSTKQPQSLNQEAGISKSRHPTLVISDAICFLHFSRGAAFLSRDEAMPFRASPP